MYDTKKKFREYRQIETLAASLCPFILGSLVFAGVIKYNKNNSL